MTHVMDTTELVIMPGAKMPGIHICNAIAKSEFAILFSFNEKYMENAINHIQKHHVRPWLQRSTYIICLYKPQTIPKDVQACSFYMNGNAYLY